VTLISEVRRRLAQDGPPRTRDEPGDFQRVTLPEPECDRLRDLLVAARVETVVEVGLAYASSALAIGEALTMVGAARPRHVIIDPFQESAYADAGWDLMRAAGLDSIAELRTAWSSVALPELVAEGFVADAAFVDGSHRFHEVFVDFYFLRKIVRPGGLVVIDDSQVPSVRTAVSYYERNLGWVPIAGAFGNPRCRAFRLPDPSFEPPFREFHPFGFPSEEALTGGNVADSVVRIGATVRKPVLDSTPAVESLLRHLADVGFDGAPRTLGRDEAGRQILEYVPGDMADTMPPMSPDELGRLGRLIRTLHDAAEGFEAPPGARWDVLIPPDSDEVICHHDLAPWNLVRDGDRWVFIDWDGAGPGSRLWDLAYAAHGFVPMIAGGDPAVDGPRLRALVDGYGLDDAQRRALPAFIGAHTRGMFELLRSSSLTGRQPWARLWADGHGDHWGPAADYIDEHLDAWTAALTSRLPSH
jgi:predicted O-methyltransferase YrrM